MYDLLYSVKTYGTRHFRQNRARPRTPSGDLISSPVGNIVSLVSPKKSCGPNSVRKNYFIGAQRPFSLLAKNATGCHNA